MRRVYDDEQYAPLSEQIMGILYGLNGHPKDVQEYSNGMERSSAAKIKQYIADRVDGIKFGRNVNMTGIGNNAAYEVIYTGDAKEEQIFGVLHLTNDMFGRHICWMSDIDGGRKYNSTKI